MLGLKISVAEIQYSLTFFNRLKEFIQKNINKIAPMAKFLNVNLIINTLNLFSVSLWSRLPYLPFPCGGGGISAQTPLNQSTDLTIIRPIYDSIDRDLGLEVTTSIYENLVLARSTNFYSAIVPHPRGEGSGKYFYFILVVVALISIALIFYYPRKQGACATTQSYSFVRSC